MHPSGGGMGGCGGGERVAGHKRRSPQRDFTPRPLKVIPDTSYKIIFNTVPASGG